MQAAPDARMLRMKAGTVWLPGLRRAREKSGLTIRQLAEEAGTSPDTVWRLETLRRAAESKTRRRLARALGTSVRALQTPDKEAEAT